MRQLTDDDGVSAPAIVAVLRMLQHRAMLGDVRRDFLIEPEFGVDEILLPPLLRTAEQRFLTPTMDFLMRAEMDVQEIRPRGVRAIAPREEKHRARKAREPKGLSDPGIDRRQALDNLHGDQTPRSVLVA